MRTLAIALALLLAGPAFGQEDRTAIEAEVADMERAFAQTMADRDFEAFASFLDEEAVFVSSAGPARGKAAIMARWKRFFEEEKAPLAWRPETVIVLESGNLALSTGPVWGDSGVPFSQYHSIWRKNADGEWKVVFDRGQRLCKED